jgi:transposase
MCLDSLPYGRKNNGTVSPPSAPNGLILYPPVIRCQIGWRRIGSKEYLEGQRLALEAEIDRYTWLDLWRRQVEALCCFRGVKVLTTMTILTELGDIRRFARPTGLMAYAGLVPSERSSGNVQRRRMG